MKPFIFMALITSASVSAQAKSCDTNDFTMTLAEAYAISNLCDLTNNTEYQANIRSIKKSLLSTCPPNTNITPTASVIADRTAVWDAKLATAPERKATLCAAMTDFISTSSKEVKQRSADIRDSKKSCNLVKDFSIGTYKQYSTAKRLSKRTDAIIDEMMRRSMDYELTAQSLYIPYSFQDFFALSESIRNDVYIKSLTPSQFISRQSDYVDKCVSRTTLNREELRQR